MDTPTIAKYYREKDPMKRKELLDLSVENGEEPETNEIRRELWEIRYQDKAEAGKNRADGYLALWMAMEFNRGAGRKLFGAKRAVKELNKHIEKLKFREYQEKGGLHQEMLYRECCHLVRTYIELCQSDRNYNSVLGGLIPVKKENVQNKMKADICETAIILPNDVGMQAELGILSKAANEMFALCCPDDGALS